MKLLKEKIRQNGPVQGSDVLDVGAFLNRMTDPHLLHEIAADFAAVFEKEDVTKVLTVESAGIGMATMTAHRLSAMSLYAQKNKGRVEKDAYVSTVSTRSELTLSVPKKYLKRTDHVLIVDDFLGTGDATNALVDIVRQAGATLVGVGVAIERRYLGGGDRLRLRGIPVHALATILSTDTAEGIVFADEDAAK